MLAAGHWPESRRGKANTKNNPVGVTYAVLGTNKRLSIGTAGNALPVRCSALTPFDDSDTSMILPASLKAEFASAERHSSRFVACGKSV
jgi:hypothetical protein